MSLKEKSFRLRVGEDESKIEVYSQENLLEALVREGYEVKSSCGGVGSCADCKIKFVEGMDKVTSPSFDEVKHLGNVFHITKERLSCQCRLLADDAWVVLEDRKETKKKPTFRRRKKEHVPDRGPSDQEERKPRSKRERRPKAFSFQKKNKE